MYVYTKDYMNLFLEEIYNYKSMDKFKKVVNENVDLLIFSYYISKGYNENYANSMITHDTDDVIGGYEIINSTFYKNKSIIRLMSNNNLIRLLSELIDGKIIENYCYYHPDYEYYDIDDQQEIKVDITCDMFAFKKLFAHLKLST